MGGGHGAGAFYAEIERVLDDGQDADDRPAHGGIGATEDVVTLHLKVADLTDGSELDGLAVERLTDGFLFARQVAGNGVMAFIGNFLFNPHNDDLLFVLFGYFS